MKLKTLKDFDFLGTIDWSENAIIAQDNIRKQLKAEAIKEVKQIRLEKGNAKKKARPGRPGIYLEMSLEEYLMKKNNLEEEDLK